MVRSEKRPLTFPRSELRRHLTEIIEAGIAAAAAPSLVRRALTDPREIDWLGATGPLCLVAAGKAARAMAAVFAAWAGRRLEAGVVVGTHGVEPLPASLTWYQGGHPLPNENSVAAARDAVRLAQTPEKGARLVCLLSGGASALLAAPMAGLSLADKMATTRALLASGAAIDELNCVRKHLSAIKGGRLAAAAAVPVVTLAISDVVGPVADDPSVIGSGPTTADATRYQDALDVVRRYGVGDRLPPAALKMLEGGARGEMDETPKPGDARLERSRFRVIGNRREALDGAARAARRLGYTVSVLPDPVVGAARDAARSYVSRVLESSERSGPVCVVAAGETTVHVTGPGRGGRNQELALAAAPLLAARGRPCMLASVGTDGIDGPTDAAGAVVDHETIARAARLRLGPSEAFLAANDSYRFFDALGDLIRTGPTETNVGDLQVALLI